MSKGYNPDQLWFTSDLHFGHRKILDFCKETRPYATVEEMNEDLIVRWNEKVKKGDTVIVCGDVSFTTVENTIEIVERLNGAKILVTGNHDDGLIKRQKFLDLFVKVSPLLEIKVQDEDALRGGLQRIVCCHFAMKVWNQQHRGAWHVYGHSHGTLAEDGSKSVDVGVESGIYPWSYWDLKKNMETKTFTVLDHHK